MRTLGVVGVLLAGGTLVGAQPLGTSFTYQGRLTDAGSPASGTYDLQLALFDAASGGTQVGPTVTRDDVIVTDGLFTASLDFGPAFAGSKRWLELRVRPGASTGSYTTLPGRQELTPSPNAVFSSAAPWTGIAGKPAGFADDIDNDSGGDITAVSAGSGLTGGGTAGAVTVGVNLGGTGSATTVSRSDHDHAGQAWSGGFTTSQGLRVTNTASGGFCDGILGIGEGVGQGRGVVGYASAPEGVNIGVWGQADSTEGYGVFGYAPAASGTTYGVSGRSDSPAGYGVYGIAAATSGASYGVMGETNSSAGIGVYGQFLPTIATGSSAAILGRNYAPFGHAVVGEMVPTVGPGVAVQGISRSPSGIGVYGVVTVPGAGPPLPGSAGVYGRALGNGYAVAGENPLSSGYAGHFTGRVHVTETLTKGGGAFKIDHPLDPENKYLYHSFVESPDMKNIYDGTVTTDDEGYASVELPDWFEALNRDFRYQLTVIGQFAQAIVAHRVEGNRFAIRTDKPNVDVSWQVTGIRRDAFAEARRIPVEEDKPEAERGTYMHPVEHGQPQEKGVDWERLASLRERSKLPD